MQVDYEFIDGEDLGGVLKLAFGYEHGITGILNEGGYCGHWDYMTEAEVRSSPCSVDMDVDELKETIMDYYGTEACELVRCGNGKFAVVTYNTDFR